MACAWFGEIGSCCFFKRSVRPGLNSASLSFADRSGAPKQAEVGRAARIYSVSGCNFEIPKVDDNLQKFHATAMQFPRAPDSTGQVSTKQGRKPCTYYV